MKLVSIIIGLALCVAFMFGGSASAWNPFDNLQCDGQGSNSTVCQAQKTNGNPVIGEDGLLLKVANVIAIVAGIAAVLVIMVAGLRMITSNGNAEEVTGARRAIVYTVVGLVVIVLARTIIALVIGGI